MKIGFEDLDWIRRRRNNSFVQGKEEERELEDYNS